MSAVTNWLYVIDYDLPTKSESKRVMFYQAVHRMLKKQLGKDLKFSTRSCYFTDNEDLAKKFLDIVRAHNGRGQIWKAMKQ